MSESAHFLRTGNALLTFLLLPTQLLGNGWDDGRPYPLFVAEAQGMIIDNIFVLYGGFNRDWSVASAFTYTLDTADPLATWQKVDDIPISQGLTHGAHVRIGTKIYNCGGYVGSHPGLHTTTCMVYDQSKPLGQRWTTITPLPDGRGGGGMFHNTALNAIYYVSGAQRYKKPWLDTLDFNTTWMYSIDNPSAGWVQKADLPYAANHMMAVTATDSDGKERHYAFGGQYRERECCGNYEYLYEYDAMNDKWIRRADMQYPRAHSSSSTIPYGCGFVVVAGNTNGGLIISNVTYYNIATNTWTDMGNVPQELNTPICDINRNQDIMYCETGRLWTSRSYKRKLGLGPAAPTAPVATAPVAQPVKAPTAQQPSPPVSTPGFPILIDSGGLVEKVDSSGRTWMADKYDSLGSAYCTSAPIDGTANDAIYQCERSGAVFSYSIPVPAGTYTVTLHFAEI
jgi:Malectin domain